MKTLLRKIETKAKTRFFALCPKTFKKTIFPKKIISQASSFNNNFLRVSIKSENFLWVISKNNEKILKFYQEKIFKTLLWTGRINFDEYAEIKTFNKKGECFFRVVSKKDRNFFSRGKFPKAYFLRRSRMEFWQTCGRFFARSWNIFLSKSENAKKRLSPKNFVSSKVSQGQVERSYETLPEKVDRRPIFFFGRNSKTVDKNCSKKDHFPQKLSVQR